MIIDKKDKIIGENQDDWTFNGVPTRDFTHIYHDYPARMIPQIPRKLFEILNIKNGLLFDPYCGSGTTLVEALLNGSNAIGTDINPLARLISEAKTDYSIDPIELSLEIEKFYTFSMMPSGKPKIPEIKNIDFWFKPNVKKALGIILSYIETIENEKIKKFFMVAFSETVRESSNTRKNEFKLYRYDQSKLSKHNPDPFIIMKAKLERNFNGYKMFYNRMMKYYNKPTAKVFGYNSVYEIPNLDIKENSSDIIITSPPYGDSHTTVAYGQYSRLSSEWLGLKENKVDKESMGGRTYKDMKFFNCKELDNAIDMIKEKNEKRALEVISFYIDLEKSINNVSKIVKDEGYTCYVIANRKVSNVELPSHIAIKCFFENNGFEHVYTFTRDIPNKRMPKLNSPSNKPGIKNETMSKEYIVIMKKI